LGRRKWQILVSTFLSETTLYWSLPRDNDFLVVLLYNFGSQSAIQTSFVLVGIVLETFLVFHCFPKDI